MPSAWTQPLCRGTASLCSMRNAACAPLGLVNDFLNRCEWQYTSSKSCPWTHPAALRLSKRLFDHSWDLGVRLGVKGIWQIKHIFEHEPYAWKPLSQTPIEHHIPLLLSHIQTDSIPTLAKPMEHQIPLPTSHSQTDSNYTHFENMTQTLQQTMSVSEAEVGCWLWKSTLQLDWCDINGAIVAKRAYSITHGYNKHGSSKPWKDCWAFLKKKDF